MTPNYSFVSRRRSMSGPLGGVGFSIDIVDDFLGMLVLEVQGAGAWDLFQAESGGHRWQRVPPNERRGKVHSSTVTVAVFRNQPGSQLTLAEKDLDISVCRGSGPGGQKKNKTSSVVQVKHKPSGLIVRCESGRSQHQNRTSALALLEARLSALELGSQQRTLSEHRRTQIGSGERSDKIRTVQVQNGIVINHRNGRRLPVDRYLKGELSGLSD